MFHYCSLHTSYLYLVCIWLVWFLTRIAAPGFQSYMSTWTRSKKFPSTFSIFMIFGNLLTRKRKWVGFWQKCQSRSSSLLIHKCNRITDNRCWDIHYSVNAGLAVQNDQVRLQNVVMIRHFQENKFIPDKTVWYLYFYLQSFEKIKYLVLVLLLTEYWKTAWYFQFYNLKLF